MSDVFGDCSYVAVLFRLCGTFVRLYAQILTFVREKKKSYIYALLHKPTKAFLCLISRLSSHPPTRGEGLMDLNLQLLSAGCLEKRF